MSKVTKKKIIRKEDEKSEHSKGNMDPLTMSQLQTSQAENTYRPLATDRTQINTQRTMTVNNVQPCFNMNNPIFAMGNFYMQQRMADYMNMQYMNMMMYNNMMNRYNNSMKYFSSPVYVVTPPIKQEDPEEEKKKKEKEKIKYERLLDDLEEALCLEAGEEDGEEYDLLEEDPKFKQIHEHCLIPIEELERDCDFCLNENTKGSKGFACGDNCDVFMCADCHDAIQNGKEHPELYNGNLNFTNVMRDDVECNVCGKKAHSMQKALYENDEKNFFICPRCYFQEKVNEPEKLEEGEKVDEKEKVEEKIEEKIVEKVEEKPEVKVEEKIIEKVEEKIVEKVEEKPEEIVEEKIVEKVEEKPEEKVEEKIKEKIVETVEEKIVEKVEGNDGEVVEKKVVETVEEKIVEKEGGEVIEEKIIKKETNEVVS